MKRGEVWWVEFEPAIGSEITKIRLKNRMTTLSANDMLAIEKIIKIHLGLS